MARLTPHQAVIDIRSRFTGEGRRRLHAQVAREAIAEADARNAALVGAPLEHEVFVDGREGAPLESVREHGVIAAVWAFHLPAIDFAWETIATLSPYRTGRYRASHLMLVDGVEHEPGLPVEPQAEVVFVNLLPYARRIERGWSGQAPNGVYEAAAEIVRARFGNIVKVEFRYRKHGDEALPSLRLTPRTRR